MTWVGAGRKLRLPAGLLFLILGQNATRDCLTVNKRRLARVCLHLRAISAILSFLFCGGLGHEEGSTVDQACACIARTTNPFYAPETGIRELERRLKEQTAVLDAYKLARKAA
jgi:hypothetical protein